MKFSCAVQTAQNGPSEPFRHIAAGTPPGELGIAGKRGCMRDFVFA